MTISMKKTFFSFLILLTINSSFAFSNFKNIEINQGNFIQAKNLNVKSFFKLFTEKYKKDTKIKCITLSGEFPKNWVQPNDIGYLISIMRSKEKCCGYSNVFSSTILNDNAEVGGFAIIFLNSYISQTKINLGLNCNPKTDKESIKKIEKWYQKQSRN